MTRSQVATRHSPCCATSLPHTPTVSLVPASTRLCRHRRAAPPAPRRDRALIHQHEDDLRHRGRRHRLRAFDRIVLPGGHGDGGGYELARRHSRTRRPLRGGDHEEDHRRRVHLARRRRGRARRVALPLLQRGDGRGRRPRPSGAADTVLFGRKTYDSFAGAWPEREAAGEEDAGLAKRSATAERSSCRTRRSSSPGETPNSSRAISSRR